MSTIVDFNYEDANKAKKQTYAVFCKGAPEIIETLLAEVPENYVKTYKFYTKKGYRVLALAHKFLNQEIDYANITREQAENQLIFDGLFICESPLKHDTAK